METNYYPVLAKHLKFQIILCNLSSFEHKESPCSGLGGGTGSAESNWKSMIRMIGFFSQQ
jgi:hypothetical protein